MHIVFIPYGIEHRVEYLKQELIHSNFQLPMENKETGQKKAMWIKGHLRHGPFGVWEYVIPREHADAVMTTLRFKQDNPYKLGKVRLNMLRKALKCEKIPEFKEDQRMLWIMDDVAIIPIGVRYDGDIVGTRQDDLGFTHEAL